MRLSGQFQGSFFFMKRFLAYKNENQAKTNQKKKKKKKKKQQRQ